MSFYFLGTGPFSKSLILRALIVQSYFLQLKIAKDSVCEDVISMKTGLKNLEKNTTINDLHGGAVLRFLALRASRKSHSFILKGSHRLFQRPTQELKMVLNQLSCDTQFTENSLYLKSQGWFLSGDALTIPAHRSSQFASAVFLNSWNLHQDLFVSIEGPIVSSSYFQMTLDFLRFLGMEIKGSYGEYCILAGQKINQMTYHPEPDMSCLFSLAALTGIEGEAIFTDWPETSLQPDFIFPSILSNMGFHNTITNNTLKITKGKKLKPIKYNMKNCPDLFPVLSALCAISDGTSHLYGAPHLRYKESHRIEQMAQLLSRVGRKYKVEEDGLTIIGQPILPEEKNQTSISFDPKKDHRMAMAAALLKKAGFPLKILNPEVVNKSFPDFWSAANIVP
ncbi:MAG: 3-phosphoshikimate 1-carboxyvinyltransferase [Bdellovibrionaceae bacterium]|nr:3-phosphoshikimate 1-carboxyvinyltransferase [Pseudobdellovibrionaceae bacterium]